MYLELDRKEKSKIAVVDMNGNCVSYGQLLEQMEEVGQIMETRSLALILCENVYAALLAYLSCLNRKVVPLLLGRATDPAAIRRFMELYCPRYIISKADDAAKNGWENMTEIKSEILAEQGYVILDTNLTGYPLYEELSLLLTTSGSTGSPKLVRHSYTNLQRQAENISAFFAYDGHERPICDLPLEYTMGLSVINSHLYAGATLLLVNVSLLSREFWTYFKEEKATSFTGVPYSYELLKRLRFTRMDLPSLEMLSQGGGKMPKELNEELVAYITGKGGKYIATYGQTEGSARMAYLPAQYAADKIGSIGVAIPHGKLYLKDENGSVIDTPFSEGEMIYEGPNVTLGYAESGADLIKGDERNGVLPTGDLAYFDNDGCFYICGRKKRFLKLFGYRVNLDECEKIIRDEFTCECACTGDDTRLDVFVTGNHDTEQVKNFLIEKTKLYPTAVTITRINEIPRSSAGKVLYSALRGKENCNENTI